MDRALEQAPGPWSSTMPTTLEAVAAKYLRSGNPAQRTREEYSTTLRKWNRWGRGVRIDLWRHVSWDRRSPNREAKEQSPWGWLFYRRVKTGKTFYRPMNRTVHTHIKSIMPTTPDPDAPVFLGGGSRPNNRFRALCDLACIKPKTDVETGEVQTWVFKDLRKTCATY